MHFNKRIQNNDEAFRNKIMNSGIYTITNKTNDKIYVGFTNNFISRKQTHFANLRSNKHDNAYLQNAWNKYGEKAFEFEILEECEEQYLASQEHYWATVLNVNNRRYGYNRRFTHPYGKSNHSKETRLKISNSKIGKERIGRTWIGKKHSEESKLKMSLSKKGIKVNRKALKNRHIKCLKCVLKDGFIPKSFVKRPFRHSEETIKKISERSNQEDNRLRIREIQRKSVLSKTGTHLSKEQKVKANTTRYGNRIIEIYSFQSKELIYSCNLVKEAIDFTGLKRSNINNNLCGLNKRAGNYTFKYKEV